MFRGNATTTGCGFTEPGRDILTDLLALLPYFERPVPVALWLVNAPELKEYILDRLGVERVKPLSESVSPTLLCLPCGGLPFYEWETWAEQEGDRKPDLPFLRAECRGLWLEMKRADHIAIKIPGAEYLAERGIAALRADSEVG